ncbi:hypothetical protein [Allochromatium vinosum]|uniref:hypothetical protein n=1 Tax=Allochromatium vinosum TaxID=1049 RepID=UPI0019050ABB|nr:hypothetical protein [Allochromatium vinosum]MBK1653359.1 hypothetical protein [Allochromatium vinosum]
MTTRPLTETKIDHASSALSKMLDPAGARFVGTDDDGWMLFEVALLGTPAPSREVWRVRERTQGGRQQ